MPCFLSENRCPLFRKHSSPREFRFYPAEAIAGRVAAPPACGDDPLSSCLHPADAEFHFRAVWGRSNPRSLFRGRASRQRARCTGRLPTSPALCCCARGHVSKCPGRRVDCAVTGVAAGGRYVEALASEVAAIVAQSEIRAPGPVRPRAREPLHARAGGLGQSKP